MCHYTRTPCSTGGGSTISERPVGYSIGRTRETHCRFFGERAQWRGKKSIETKQRLPYQPRSKGKFGKRFGNTGPEIPDRNGNPDKSGRFVLQVRARRGQDDGAAEVRESNRHATGSDQLVLRACD